MDAGGRRHPGELTTPDPLVLAGSLGILRDRGVELTTMEVSSHALDQRRVDGLRFDYAAFTSFSREHLDYHEEMTSYRAAKLRFAELLAPDGVLVINGDEPAWDSLRAAPGEIVTTGFGDGLQVRADSVEPLPGGTRFRLCGEYGEALVELPLIGRFNVENALSAAGIALHLGMPPAEVAERLGSVPQVPGRFEILNREPVLVLRDYAHTPDAFRLALEALRPLVEGRLIMVFGCGGDRDAGKRPLMGEVRSESPRRRWPGWIRAPTRSCSIGARRSAGPGSWPVRAMRCSSPARATRPTRSWAAASSRSMKRRERAGRDGGAGVSERVMFSSNDVREALGLPPDGGGNSYTSVSIDTRTLQPGALFVALKGERHDAVDLLPEAEARGAVGAVVPEDRALPVTQLELFGVADATRALGDLAAWHRKASGVRVVGITGSSGKTTVKEMAAAVLGSGYRVYKTAGNLNSQVGLPLAILEAPTRDLRAHGRRRHHRRTRASGVLRHRRPSARGEALARRGRRSGRNGRGWGAARGARGRRSWTEARCHRGGNWRGGVLAPR